MRAPDRRGATPDPPRARARRTGLHVAIIAATALAGSAQAGQLDYRFELEALHSDNINLSEDNQATETVLVPRLNFEFKESGASVELQARGQLERRHYFGSRFDDETRSEFAGQLNWSLLPKRLNLVLEDYLSEEPIDIRGGRYPGNLQRVNIFLGGPSFFARLGDATRFQLDLRGVSTHAEVAPDFDGKRHSAAASLQRDLTPTSKASLNLISTKAEFDDAPFAVDYTRHDAFVRYEGRLRKVEYELDLGHSRLNRDIGEDPTTTVARATVQWQPDSRNRVRLRARHQFADQVQDLVVRLREPDESLVPDLVDTASSLVSSGVYRQRDVELDYRYRGERAGLRVRPLYRQLRYIDRADANRTERGVFFQVDYRLRPLVTVFLTGSLRDREFLSRSEEDRDRAYSLGVSYQMTRHWGWRAEAIRNERESNVPDQEYTENALLLAVWWQR